MPTHPDELLSIEALAREMAEAIFTDEATARHGVRVVLHHLFSPASGLGLVEALEPFARLEKLLNDDLPADARVTVRGWGIEASVSTDEIEGAAKAIATIRGMME